MIDLAFILLIALVLDWIFGDPDQIWSRIPHPVAWMGSAIKSAERRLNHFGAHGHSAAKIRRAGIITIFILVVGAAFIGGLVQDFLNWNGGWFIEAIVVSIMLAQKSLWDHATQVALGLQTGGVDQGRKMVGRMVGRDPQYLDQSGICRATIESVAENFCDGVVAPAFWYLIFGLPGLFAYKMINTADSMIGYKSERYANFGRASAILDDFANWLPARISVGLLLIGGGVSGQAGRVRMAFFTVLRDAGLHSSPNAGWPEAAMAALCNIALGGPRNYGDNQVAQSYINASGKLDLDTGDINRALHIFTGACFAAWAIVALIALIF